MKTRNIIYKGLLIMTAIIGGCNEDVLNKVNPSQLSDATYYTNEQEIVTGVNAVYAAWQGLDTYAREYFFIHDLRGDDMQPGGDNLELQRRQLIEGTLDPSNPVMNSVWNGMYRVINRANTIIEFAPRPEVDASDAMKARVVGEAKFHRAWAYFELVSMWGDVPLYSTRWTADTDSKPRAASSEVYALIIQDLTDAIGGLPDSYDADNVGRITKNAARAMLGRVHLQLADFAAAKAVLDPIVASGLYELTDEYLDNFQEENEFNEESLLEVAFSSSFGGLGWNPTGDGTSMEVTIRGQEYGPNAWRNLIPSNSILAEYETDEPRFEGSYYQIGDTYNNGASTITEMQNNDPKLSWRKYQMIYKQESEDQRSGINFRVIRYAEVLLMLAEVENELNNPSVAIDYLNDIRDRPSVMMPHYPTADYPCTTKDEVFEAMMHEKRIELAGEQIRNRDILRWREAGKFATDPISYFQAKHALLPIPQAEIDNNPEISNADQNLGY